MHELAGFMRLKLSSATGLVDRMVKHGLVKRCRCEVDRRVVRVSITAKGKKILPQIYKQKRKGIIKLFAALSSKERAQYLSLVEKLVQQLASREPGS